MLCPQDLRTDQLIELSSRILTKVKDTGEVSVSRVDEVIAYLNEWKSRVTVKDCRKNNPNCTCF